LTYMVKPHTLLIVLDIHG